MSNYLTRPIRLYTLTFMIASLLGWAGVNTSAQAQASDSTSNPMDAPPLAEPGSAHLAEARFPQPPDLPDAPEPALARVNALLGESTSLSGDFDFTNWAGDARVSSVSPNLSERVPLDQCPSDNTGARECRVHWRHLFITTSVFNAFQNAGNLYTGYWYRWETLHGKWFDRWIDSAADWRWNVWDDDNPHMDQYVGHPIMGSITNYLWIQDDPKGATLDIANTPEYWRSRMRAFLFSTAYSFEWKLGPFGEAAIGHNGDHYFYDKGHYTNETGWVELVTTPVGGFLWTLAEDELDKHIVKRIEGKPRGPFTLLVVSFLTPTRATANILRFRPPWYRDGREVKARTFWSEPPGPSEAEAGSDEPAHGGPGESAAVGPGAGASSGVAPVRDAEGLPLWPHYGGVHEFGAWWGLSLISGHIWGYAKDIKYMPVDVSYSYLLYPGAKWNFRYAPEVTALAMLDEPTPSNPNFLDKRKRTYGSGLSPVGFRANFFPESRVQPFLSGEGGFIYFVDRVLSPQGSQYMYTVDFGGGLQIFRTQRQSVTIGYRYQHLSNANISHHNPGTDTNVFYVAVSRFRTKGYR